MSVKREPPPPPAPPDRRDDSRGEPSEHRLGLRGKLLRRQQELPPNHPPDVSRVLPPREKKPQLQSALRGRIQGQNDRLGGASMQGREVDAAGFADARSEGRPTAGLRGDSLHGREVNGRCLVDLVDARSKGMTPAELPFTPSAVYLSRPTGLRREPSRSRSCERAALPRARWPGRPPGSYRRRALDQHSNSWPIGAARPLPAQRSRSRHRSELRHRC
mmetsp:Transcript_36540/g.66470  ORF Transcript_36540/g.66470 Transcript_36540/m.66470 type:complete len:218 (+) Transcript_36540:3-656(+)